MAPGSALIPRPVGSPSGAEALRFRFALPARPSSAAGARRLTRDRLAVWKLRDDLRDTAALIVSELVTNAVVHTASALVVCELRRLDHLLRIAVQDQGRLSGGPKLRASSDDEHGRGLFLVDALSQAWGSHDAEDASGRVVWSELAHSAGQPC